MRLKCVNSFFVVLDLQVRRKVRTKVIFFGVDVIGDLFEEGGKVFENRVGILVFPLSFLLYKSWRPDIALKRRAVTRDV
jgi:hypothetical protein